MIWTPRKRLWKPADRRGLLAFSIAGCCCCECEACLNCQFPDEFQVDLADIADGSCTDCDEKNGTWVVGRNHPTEPECRELSGGGWVAFWYDEYPGETMCGDDFALQVDIRWIPGTGERRVRVLVLREPVNQNQVRYELIETSQSAPFTCPDFNATDIPFVLNIGCSGTSSCLLTAL